jgi:hypothetical protein
MKQFQVPAGLVDPLKPDAETGIGYCLEELNDVTAFDQVSANEGCIIEVRGHKEIRFNAASVRTNHKRWNFRDVSDARAKTGVRPVNLRLAAQSEDAVNTLSKR